MQRHITTIESYISKVKVSVYYDFTISTHVIKVSYSNTVMTIESDTEYSVALDEATSMLEHADSLIEQGDTLIV